VNPDAAKPIDRFGPIGAHPEMTANKVGEDVDRQNSQGIGRDKGRPKLSPCFGLGHFGRARAECREPVLGRFTAFYPGGAVATERVLSLRPLGLKSAALRVETLMSLADETLPPSKVLIVDDNPQNLELLEAYLEELPNVTTLSAHDGQSCLDLVARERPDLILLDIMMPRMSGYEVCKKVKAEEATRDIPVIMVTALHEMGDVERGAEVGANDFVTKPVNRVDLLGRVKTLLRVRHAAKASEAPD